MRILHLTLGVPPYRSGGLPGYAYSVACEEKKLGHEVYMLYPGELNPLFRKTRIKKTVLGKSKDVIVYKLVNPNYVAVPYGVKNPNAIVHDGPDYIYSDFLDAIKPDLIHVHTFMGFHKEFFIEIKKRGIFCLFTTHDYYPICPRTTLVDYQDMNCSGFEAAKCCVCNAGVSYSPVLQYIIQSKWYPHLKNSRIINALKRYRYFRRESAYKPIENSNDSYTRPVENIDEYRRFFEYQKEMFSAVNLVHYNSSLSERIYRPYVGDINSFILNITSTGISDNRKQIRHFNFEDDGVVNVGYIGINSFHKGVDLLLEAAAEVYAINPNFRLLMYGDEYRIDEKYAAFCESKGVFKHNDLTTVLKEIDLLIVPSIWNETFGFTVLEAVANNVAVIVSSNVGSKDLLESVKMPHVFSPNINDLKRIIVGYISKPEDIRSLQQELSRLTINVDIKSHTIDLLQKIEDCKAGILL
jgi:glycosyltransferase involved in cell wall biosynthesis